MFFKVIPCDHDCFFFCVPTSVEYLCFCSGSWWARACTRVSAYPMGRAHTAKLQVFLTAQVAKTGLDFFVHVDQLQTPIYEN